MNTGYRKVRHREGSPKEGLPQNWNVRHSFGRFATNVIGRIATTLECIIKQVTSLLFIEGENIFISLDNKNVKEITHYTVLYNDNTIIQGYTVFSTGRDISSITYLEIKCLLFFQGSETNVPTYFLSVLNTGRQLSN